jgi:hypothetical protein
MPWIGLQPKRCFPGTLPRQFFQEITTLQEVFFYVTKTYFDLHWNPTHGNIPMANSIGYFKPALASECHNEISHDRVKPCL